MIKKMRIGNLASRKNLFSVVSWPIRLMVLIGISSSLSWAGTMSVDANRFYVQGYIMNSTHTVTFDGIKKREETNEETTAGGFWHTHESTIEILHADTAILWRLNPKKKRYTEHDLKIKPKALVSVPESTPIAQKPPEQKAQVPEYRIKSVQSNVKGPGPSETTSGGITCQPYWIKIDITYETLPDKKEAGTFGLYEKQCVAWDIPNMQAFTKDTLAFEETLSSTIAGQKLDFTQWIKMMQQFTNSPHASKFEMPEDNWMRIFVEKAKAEEKIKGTPVRTVMSFMFPNESASAEPPAPEKSAEDDLVQSSDLSGGVSGALTGITSRWLSKKAEKKVDAKMKEHPAWVDEFAKDFQLTAVPMLQLQETIRVDLVSPDPSLFEIPKGYKKVADID